VRVETPFATVAALLALFAGGCSRCTTEAVDEPKDAAPPVTTAEPVSKASLLPPPAPWTFSPKRIGPGRPGVALPSGCRERAPLVRAKVAASTRFVASPTALGTLVVADADPAESPPRLLGVAAMTLSAEGASTGPVALPWLDAAAMPRLSRTSAGTWLAAYDEPGEGRLSRVLVYRGEEAWPMGEGDRFDAVDLACGASACALLTTRLGTVATAGAELFVGSPDEPVSSWKRTEIAPAAAESDARPSCIARVESASGVVATLLEGGELVFWEANAGAEAREMGRMPAPFGMLDAIVTNQPIALVYGSAVDDEGCAQEGGKLRFERPQKGAIEIRSHAPPTSGALRALTRGVLATYLAPMGCDAPRKVVYAVVLDAEGAPISAPMPVADATSYAVAARGEEVDLWIQEGDEVTWVRASCAAP